MMNVFKVIMHIGTAYRYFLYADLNADKSTSFWVIQEKKLFSSWSTIHLIPVNDSEVYRIIERKRKQGYLIKEYK